MYQINLCLRFIQHGRTQLSERAISHRIELEQAYVMDPKLKIGHSAKKKKNPNSTITVFLTLCLHKQIGRYVFKANKVILLIHF